MTTYYLTFTDATGKTFTADGSALYQISNFDLSTLQALNIGSQSSGAGAGKITFNPLTFTLGSSQLTQKLDQWLALGAALDQINLVGFDTGANGKPVEISDDVFKLAAVKSDAIDASTGAHSFSVEYGGLVESVTPINAAGSLGTPVVDGWNRVQNIEDKSLTSGIGGLPNVTLPTLDPAKAIAPAGDTAGEMFARLLGSDGKVIGSGWIALSDASFGLEQTLNIGSQSTGAGAGKVTFDPLTLRFKPGTLEPLLLKTEAAGTTISQIDVAVYAAAGNGGALTTDYRFGVTAIATSDKTAAGAGTVDYTIDYGSEQIATYASGSTTPVIEGWDRVKNVADTAFTAVAPTTLADVEKHLATDPACYCSGTMILTDRGEVAVEALRIGDLLVTIDGSTKPIVWIGRSTVSARFADPIRSFPIRITAGALGENIPSRDLLVSPDHALLVEELLINAGALVNGTSIVRESSVPEFFVYHHVELHDHSVILAENAPAETFVDNVDRFAFDNWAEHKALYPEGKSIEELPYPRAKAQRQVPMRIRMALDARAKMNLGGKIMLVA